MSLDPNEDVAPSISLRRRRRRFAAIFWTVCILVAMGFFLLWLLFWRFKEYTDDAYVEGNQVYITPLRPGFVTSIHTDDTFLVEKGQLLVELDRTDATISLDQTKKEFAKVVREVCQTFHQVFAYRAEIEIKRAELIKSAQDFKHREDVLAAAGVSVEDYEHAVAALRSGYFALKMTESLYDKSLAFVQGTSIRNHPLVLAAADRIRDAWVQLYRCQIYSPVSGLTAQRTIQVGMWANSGHPLMSVIPLDQIWINANFKETQLKHMRLGQPVRITSDLYGPDIVFHGKIIGLPGAAGNAFSLLPPQNLSGNWIKIVQRLPVRVSLDPEELKNHPLRVGLSMKATVDLFDQQGGLIPDSSAGSPMYSTSIFECEEQGDLELIDQIFQENLDPILSYYSHNPIYLLKPDLDKEMQNHLSSIGLSRNKEKQSPADEYSKIPTLPEDVNMENVLKEKGLKGDSNNNDIQKPKQERDVQSKNPSKNGQLPSKNLPSPNQEPEDSQEEIEILTCDKSSQT